MVDAVTWDPLGWLGLARSLLIYRARPWKIAQLARFYGRFLTPDDLAFDIGAHVGNRSLAILRTGARLVAVEPQPLFSAFLRHNLPPRATLLPIAIGAEKGNSRMQVSRLHPTVSSLAPDFPKRMSDEPGFGHVRWDANVSVEVTTLDQLIATHGRPKFIKIDVEGYEAAVLRGLSMPVDVVAFEYLPGAAEIAKACLAQLNELGPYDFNCVLGEAVDFEFGQWVTAAELQKRIARFRRSGDVYARLRET